MIRFSKITDLNDGRNNSISGWETNAANAYNVVFYTGNNFAAYSTDYGLKFNSIDFNATCAVWGETNFCDNAAIYIPYINRFAWVCLTTNQNIVIAITEPKDVGNHWNSYLLKAESVVAGKKFDNPYLAVSNQFLYIACNIGGTDCAIRIPTMDFFKDSINIHWHLGTGDELFWMKPAQQTTGIGYFAQLIGDCTTIRVFAWPEWNSPSSYFDIPIQIVPTEDIEVTLPDSSSWISIGRD